MSNSLRAIKRQKDRDSDELPPQEQKLPVGRVMTNPIKGTFATIPLLGWIAVRQRDRIPLVMLALALLEYGREEDGIRGTLQVEMPLYLDTEAATLAALERYGWRGARWAVGDPPPNDDPDLAIQLTALLAQNPILRSTLLFEPHPETGDTLTQTVEVMRARGNFLMEPLPLPEGEPHAERLQALRNLVLDFRGFYSEVPEEPSHA